MKLPYKNHVGRFTHVHTRLSKKDKKCQKGSKGNTCRKEVKGSFEGTLGSSFMDYFKRRWKERTCLFGFKTSGIRGRLFTISVSRRHVIYWITETLMKGAEEDTNKWKDSPYSAWYTYPCQYVHVSLHGPWSPHQNDNGFAFPDTVSKTKPISPFTSWSFPNQLCPGPCLHFPHQPLFFFVSFSLSIL